MQNQRAIGKGETEAKVVPNNTPEKAVQPQADQPTPAPTPGAHHDGAADSATVTTAASPVSQYASVPFVKSESLKVPTLKEKDAELTKVPTNVPYCQLNWNNSTRWLNNAEVRRAVTVRRMTILTAISIPTPTTTTTQIAAPRSPPRRRARPIPHRA